MSDEQSGGSTFLAELKELRWRALIPCCFMMFGSYYVYDFPGTLGTGPHGTIQERFLNHGKPYTQDMNQVLYSVYNWPNTVLAFFGGLLIDKFLGLRKASILFTFLVCLGTGLFLVGVLTLQYPLLVVGRVLFGMGGESGYASQCAMASRWFDGKPGMSLAFGMIISISRLAATMNFYFSLSFAKQFGVEIAVLFGFGFSLFALVCALILAATDTYAEKKKILPPQTVGNVKPEDEVKIKDVCKLPLVHWLVCVITALSYSCLLPFVGVVKNFFEVKYDISGPDASKIAAIFQFAAVVGCPLIGVVVDKVGRFSYWIILSCAVFLATHLLGIFWNTFPPVLMILVLGAGYALLFSSLWPSVPYLIPKNLSGVAFGLMTAIQNTGLAIVPLITGAILTAYTPKKHDGSGGDSSDSASSGGLNAASSNAWEDSSSNSSSSILDTPAPTGNHNPLPTLEGFKLTEVVFAVCAGGAMLGGIILYIRDIRTNKILSSSPSVRNEINAQREKEQEGLLNNGENEGETA